MSTDQLSPDLAQAFVALADPTRREIFERVAAGPRAVGELAADLPVTRPAVSQHLRVLSEARLVSATAIGTRRIYRLDPAGLAGLRAYLDGFWTRALASYAETARRVAADRGRERHESHETPEMPAPEETR